MACTGSLSESFPMVNVLIKGWSDAYSSEKKKLDIATHSIEWVT